MEPHVPGGVWAWLQEQVDPARYRPAAAAGVLVQQSADHAGPYFMLKNPAAGTSQRLDEHDYSLWQLMDGDHTVEELVVAHYRSRGSYNPARVAEFVARLRHDQMLADPPLRLYAWIEQELAARRPVARLLDALRRGVVRRVTSGPVAIAPVRLRLGAKALTEAAPWRSAALALLIIGLLLVIPLVLGAAGWIKAAGLIGLVATMALAARGYSEYAGSRVAPAMALLALAALAMLFREVNLPTAGFPVLRLGGDAGAGIASVIAASALVLAGLFLIAPLDLKDLYLAEKLLLGLGLLGSHLLAAWIGRAQALNGGSPVMTALAVAQAVGPLLALGLVTPRIFSFWGTRSAAAWSFLGLGLAGLAGAELAGAGTPVRVILASGSYLCLAASLALLQLVLRATSLPTPQVAAGASLNDAQRLEAAFAHTVAALGAAVRDLSGVREIRLLTERFNLYASTAGWQVRLTDDQIRTALPAEFSLAQRAEIYTAALNLFLDLAVARVGEKQLSQALGRAYDNLPWDEREIAADYLFPRVPRASVIGRQFQIMHQDHSALLRRVPLFADMDETEIDLLCSVLVLERYGPGRAIVREGEHGDKFYVIKQGHVEATQRDPRGIARVVGQLDPGSYLGELALLNDAPRAATCTATIPTEVLALRRADFERLVKRGLTLRTKVDRSLQRLALLRAVPLFAELDAQRMQLIAVYLREESYEPGAVIMRQGEPGDIFYVIQAGRVEVVVARGGAETVVDRFGPGEYVGEIALLQDVPRTATVRALTELRLLALDRKDFKRLIAADLTLSRGLERQAGRRLSGMRYYPGLQDGVGESKEQR